jgi:deoxyribodipyrimidine photolyase-related protein
MQTCTLVFPHQLYLTSSAFNKEAPIFILEDALFFTQFSFHKQKLLLHRLTMRHWQLAQENKGYKVTKVGYKECSNLVDWITSLTQKHATTLHTVQLIEPDDFLLKKRLLKACDKNGLKAIWHNNPGFITPEHEFDRLTESHKGYFMHRFYVNQRKSTGILVDKQQKPIGNKWSFDADNRKKLPTNIIIPAAFSPAVSPFFNEEADKINSEFTQNPGSTNNFNYPVTHEDASLLLEDFLELKLKLFGDYEDAISNRSNTLWHSLLSPVLNIGLLTPEYILQKTLDFAASNEVNLNSLEGFIRQLIGWREFMRIVYLQKGSTIRNSNFFNHTNKMPAAFYSGNSGIIPMDNLVKQLHNSAYSHHIQRLMVAGNLMLLCQINPHAIYQWFMEMYIDAYDWVMVPNVYSMSQYADGGLITTKPYISGSSYLLKMSDFKKGEWCAQWDSLYWNFILKHTPLLKDNIRMKMMLALAAKMPNEKQQNHTNTAQLVLQNLAK